MDEHTQPTPIPSSSVQTATAFLTVPMAILLAGIIIAGAVVYSSNGGSFGTRGQQPAAVAQALNQQAENIQPVTAADHILGDPKAPIKIVEFSDTECPFCKRFHFTMVKLMQEYGPTGKLAWVYRHAPLDSLHSKARAESEATECAFALGGNDKFWSYLTELMTVTPSNDGLDLAELPKIATRVGLNEATFKACQERHASKDKIQAQLQDATDSGMNGTPYSIVIAANGKKFPIEGAQDLATVKTVIEKALAEK